MPQLQALALYFHYLIHSPAIVGGMLELFVGEDVRLPCEIILVENGVAKVKALDGREVDVILEPDTIITEKFVSFCGTPEGEGKLKMKSYEIRAELSNPVARVLLHNMMVELLLPATWGIKK